MLGFQLVLPLEGAALLKEVWLWSVGFQGL